MVVRDYQVSVYSLKQAKCEKIKKTTQEKQPKCHFWITFTIGVKNHHFTLWSTCESSGGVSITLFLHY